MENLVFIALILGLVAVAFGGTWLCCAISVRISTHIEQKRKAQHPHLWELFAEVDEKSKASTKHYNRKVAPVKKEIESILKTLDYWPLYIRRQKEAELENLRLRLYAEELEYKVLTAENDELRKEIREYINRNNLEWAKKWGW